MHGVWQVMHNIKAGANAGCKADPNLKAHKCVTVHGCRCIRLAHATVSSRTHVANIRLRSTRAQVNSPALRSPKLFDWTWAVFFPLVLWNFLCGGAQTFLRGCSAFSPGSTQVHGSLSQVDRVPAASTRLECAALPSPALPLSHTAAEGNVRMGSVALHFLSCPSLPLRMRCSRALLPVTKMLAPAFPLSLSHSFFFFFSLCWAELQAISPSSFRCFSIDSAGFPLSQYWFRNMFLCLCSL